MAPAQPIHPTSRRNCSKADWVLIYGYIATLISVVISIEFAGTIPLRYLYRHARFNFTSFLGKLYLLFLGYRGSPELEPFSENALRFNSLSSQPPSGCVVPPSDRESSPASHSVDDIRT